MLYKSNFLIQIIGLSLIISDAPFVAATLLSPVQAMKIVEHNLLTLRTITNYARNSLRNLIREL